MRNPSEFVHARAAVVCRPDTLMIARDKTVAIRQQRSDLASVLTTPAAGNWLRVQVRTLSSVMMSLVSLLMLDLL